ncbi:MAG TPA: AAA family ATPase [Candidatus Paceibacterota bacterium]|nr:AAA family ATPase [Candidatus Paceibacterota bacterium]
MHIKEIKNISRPAYLGGNHWDVSKLKPLTFLMGKNGCGKTTLLNSLVQKLRSKVVQSNDLEIIFNETVANSISIDVSKITAERGGNYRLEGNVATNIAANDNFVFESQIQRFSQNFREQVASRYERLLANLASDDKEGDDRPQLKIDKIIEALNTIVPKKYSVIRKRTNLSVIGKESKAEIDFASLSSGEIEIFTLALDCLITANWNRAENQHKILVIDEPDVHIHPDLQIQFLKFIYKLVEIYGIQVIIGTHSTTFVANIKDNETAIIWMHEDATELRGESKRETIKDMAEIMGSNFALQLLINHKILLVEGMDDEEVWMQAIKSSDGKVHAYVHECKSNSEMKKIENGIEKLLKSLCDESENTYVVISLRDKDRGESEIDDRKYVRRFKTKCHELENCILSDNYLAKYSKTVAEIYTGDRLNDDIKERVDELNESITGDKKWWRKNTGQLIGQIIKDNKIDSESGNPTSIVNFIGIDLLKALISE